MNPLDKLDSRFISTIDGKLTFAGVIIENFNDMAKNYGWDSNTQIKYIYRFNTILRILCPNYISRPIQSYTEEDYKHVISVIRKKRTRRGTFYTASDINHFMYLMCIVTRTAEKTIEGYDDVLWGSGLSAVARGKKTEEILTYEFHSFTPEQEVVIFHKLTDSPESLSGEDWALCLSYSFGCRNNESPAVLFKNVLLSCPDGFLYVYESESSKTGKIVSSTKSPNGNRPIPCPEKIYENIKIRFKVVSQYVADHMTEVQKRISQMPARVRNYYPRLSPDTVEEFCMSLPIACKGDDYLVPTTSRRITDAGRKFFKNIGLDEDIFYFAEIMSRIEEAENHILVHDPSAYLFRRNFMTHAYICLMSVLPGTFNVHPIAALQLIGGHKIEFGALDRQKMRDEAVLQPIKYALLFRPLVNTLSPKTLSLSFGDNLANYQLLHNEEIEISCRSSEKILMTIDVDEPHDNTTVHFSVSPQQTAHAEMFTNVQSSLFEYHVNILKGYQTAYLNADKEYLQKMETNNQEDIATDNNRQKVTYDTEAKDNDK